jgi:hypothetical protein
MPAASRIAWGKSKTIWAAMPRINSSKTDVRLGGKAAEDKCPAFRDVVAAIPCRLRREEMP